MNVADVPTRDWPLYFSDTYMIYKDRVCKVEVTTKEGRTCLYLKPNKARGSYVYTKEALRQVMVWWPRPGTYNLGNSCGYVARKAARCMKKSASPRTHYYIKWSTLLDNYGGYSPIKYLAEGTIGMDWPTARKKLEDGQMGVGLTRDIALCPIFDNDMRLVQNQYKVIFRGQTEGKIVDGEYIPENGLSTTTKLVVGQLLQEGVI